MGWGLWHKFGKVSFLWCKSFFLLCNLFLIFVLFLSPKKREYLVHIQVFKLLHVRWGKENCNVGIIFLTRTYYLLFGFYMLRGSEVHWFLQYNQFIGVDEYIYSYLPTLNVKWALILRYQYYRLKSVSIKYYLKKHWKCSVV